MSAKATRLPLHLYSYHPFSHLEFRFMFSFSIFLFMWCCSGVRHALFILFVIIIKLQDAPFTAFRFLIFLLFLKNIFQTSNSKRVSCLWYSPLNEFQSPPCVQSLKSSVFPSLYSTYVFFFMFWFRFKSLAGVFFISHLTSRGRPLLPVISRFLLFILSFFGCHFHIFRPSSLTKDRENT